MKNVFCTILAALFITACARPSPEMQVIQDAAEALGGTARIQQIKTLTIEGEAVAPNLGQNLTAESELPIWKVTEFKRQIDLANQRTRCAARTKSNGLT